MTRSVPRRHRLWKCSADRNEEIERSEQFVRENINTMAVKLGQMQAQLIQLDTLGSRLAKLAGVKPPEPITTSTPPGQGGPLVNGQPQSADELAAAIHEVVS